MQKSTQIVHSSNRDPIAEWLRVFSMTLGLPDAERRAIVDDLEDHLRARVDDLLILGATEHDAVQRAIAELGETAELAGRFRQAKHGQRRRQLMSWTAIGIAGIAVAVSSVGVFGPRGAGQAAAVQASAVTAEASVEGAQPDHYPDRPPIVFKGGFSVTLGDKSFEDIMTAAAERAGLRSSRLPEWPNKVRFNRAVAELPLAVRTPEGRVHMVSQTPGFVEERRQHVIEAGTIEDLLGSFEELDVGLGGLDYRVRDGELVLGSQQTLAAEESVSKAYDLTTLSLPGGDRMSGGQVHNLLSSHLSYQTSQEPGGYLTYTEAGDVVFIRATPNYHEALDEVLEPLRERRQAALQEEEAKRRERLAMLEAELVDLRAKHSDLRHRLRENQMRLDSPDAHKAAWRAQIIGEGELADLEGFIAAIRERIVDTKFAN
ncbi:MAG: permease prefix domain 1-containing protein [Planctomycetota bacterium]